MNRVKFLSLEAVQDIQNNSIHQNKLNLHWLIRTLFDITKYNIKNWYYTLLISKYNISLSIHASVRASVH